MSLDGDFGSGLDESQDAEFDSIETEVDESDSDIDYSDLRSAA